MVVCLCQPCDELETYPGCTLPSPNVSWDQLRPPLWPWKWFQIMDGWIITLKRSRCTFWGQKCSTDVWQPSFLIREYDAPMLPHCCFSFKVFLPSNICHRILCSQAFEHVSCTNNEQNISITHQHTPQCVEDDWHDSVYIRIRYSSVIFSPCSNVSSHYWT